MIIDDFGGLCSGLCRRTESIQYVQGVKRGQSFLFKINCQTFFPGIESGNKENYCQAQQNSVNDQQGVDTGLNHFELFSMNEKLCS